MNEKKYVPRFCLKCNTNGKLLRVPDFDKKAGYRVYIIECKCSRTFPGKLQDVKREWEKDEKEWEKEEKKWGETY